MNTDFQFQVKSLGEGIEEWLIQGHFGEDAVVPKDIDLAKLQELHINFDGTDFINSSGIKAWISLADKMEEHPNLKVIFKNCPQMIVNQMNLIEGFLPSNGEVESVYLPIYCEKCDKVFNVSMEMERLDFQLSSALDRVAPDDCAEFPACKGQMEIDVVTKDYFRFNKAK